jgi:hypothetical protein
MLASKSIGTHVAEVVMKIQLLHQLQHSRLFPKISKVRVFQEKVSPITDYLPDVVGSLFHGQLGRLTKFLELPWSPVIVEICQR